jgi:hypothetical protein
LFISKLLLSFEQKLGPIVLLLKNAARRQYAKFWSAKRHPIYKLIKVSHKEQMLRLKPQVQELIENASVISRSGLWNQHQGLDAIFEEVYKELKIFDSTCTDKTSLGNSSKKLQPNLYR